MSEFPIIDSIPIIVANLRSYVSQNIFSIYGRNDLSATLNSLLGDCCGPGSAFDTQRQQLSTYCHNHYGDNGSQSDESAISLGSVTSILQHGINKLGNSFDGPVIDMGCSVGRTTFDLADLFDEITVGIDLNFPMLKTAQKILECGTINYPLRQTGLVYDEVTFPLEFKNTHNIDFWLCDAADLPFADNSFSFANSMNLLDCVNSPYQHLKELSRVLRKESCALISTPYDWNQNATPVEAWLGGHSQRSDNQGAPEVVIRTLLTDLQNPNAIQELSIIFEEENVPWKLRLHKRSIMEYLLHIFAVKKTG